MNAYHNIDGIKIAGGMLSVKVDDQLIRKNLIEISPRLAHASQQELNHYEISPSGYGIYWPLIDEDISIDGLLGIVHSPASWRKSA
ncbi:MAG: DUF2442 domain-containing protein [Methylovulum sp.]|nr:DUF2442 domain-containing protein [Methylovulum sp.]